MTEQMFIDWTTTEETATARKLLDQAPQRPAAPKPHLRVVPEQTECPVLDRRGLPRTRATMPGYGNGRPPVSKGRRYPPDPPTAEDINAMLGVLAKPRSKHETRHGAMSRRRLAAAIIVLWRTGARISEFLDLYPRDLNREDRCITIRCGKGGKRRIVMMDEWGWKALDAWTELRDQLPHGPVFCVISGVTAGQSWQSADVRRQLKHTAERAGVKRRIAPHQFRHALAVGLYHEDVPAFAIKQQLGHARLDMLVTYLASLAPTEVLAPIADRPAPVMRLEHGR